MKQYNPIEIHLAHLYKIKEDNIPECIIYAFKLDDVIEYSNSLQATGKDKYKIVVPEMFSLCSGLIMPIRKYKEEDFSIYSTTLISFLHGKELYVIPMNKLLWKISNGDLILLEE
jgi:hypothetical protein